MTACPPDDRLAALLVDTPGGDDTPALDAHLADCPNCQARLDALSEPPRLAEWIGTRPGRTALPFLDPPDRPADLGRVGRYRVEAELGRGGMGVVLRAWDDELRRHVALKVMRVGRDDEQAAARFAREARAVAALRNDHVVPVLGIEHTRDGQLVIVMPVVAGPTLRDRVRTPPGLAPREAAELVRQVADGLAAAHAAGVVHRDVKPANVLIEAATGRAKLTDFGLARPAAEGDTLTHDGTLVGTPEYMSPEQAADPARANARADVYSLGVTLYECLTGVVPFRGAPLDVMHRHAATEPIPPRRLNAAVPIDLDTVCLKCLEKMPARRYESAAAVRDELDRWLTGRPVLARPLGAVGRAARWCRRNPLPVAIVVVAAIGAAASAAGWRQAWLRAGEAARSAETARTEEAKSVAARKLADEKSALAEERSALALGAVTTLITKAQDIAGDSPGTLRVKHRLTEAALTDLRKLSEAAARVPGADHAAVTAHLRLGEALNLLGQSDEALREYDRARDAALRLLVADPADSAARRDQSRAHAGLAAVRVRLAQYAAAGADAQAAVTLAHAAAAARPEAPMIEALAAAHGARGDVFWLTGRAAPALAEYDAAIRQFTRLLPLAPDPAAVRSRLLLITTRVGYANISLRHDYATAERHFRDQLAVAAEQLAKTPDDRTWQRNHLIVHLDLSAALQRQGRTAEAEALANEALPALEKAAAADPDNALTQRDLATGFTHRGRAQMTAGRYADAEQSLARGLDILERVAARAEAVSLVASDLPVVHYELAIAVQRQERFADAAKHIDGMIATVRKLAGPGADAASTKNVLATIAAGRAAVALTGAAAADPKVIDAQPPLVALVLASERATLLARRGDVAAARREALALCARAPGGSVGFQCRALVEGVAAGRAADPAEKERCVAAGAAALIAAVRMDRSVLDTAHLFPELVAIRTAPAFVGELRTLLGTAD